jgi:hypothetical protein
MDNRHRTGFPTAEVLGPQKPRPPDDEGWLDFTPRLRESFSRALQECFQHAIEFLRVVDEQGVAVAIEFF